MIEEVSIEVIGFLPLEFKMDCLFAAVFEKEFN